MKKLMVAFLALVGIQASATMPKALSPYDVVVPSLDAIPPRTAAWQVSYILM
jgi:hypothetical protein